MELAKSEEAGMILTGMQEVTEFLLENGKKMYQMVGEEKNLWMPLQ